jgi:FkbM family methyltransferase
MKFLKNNTKALYLYGAGVYGKMVFEKIAIEHPGMKVEAFIDSYKSGHFLEKKILSLDDFLKSRKEDSLVIVATGEPSSINEISKLLSANKINYLIHAAEDGKYTNAEMLSLNEAGSKLVFGADCFKTLVGCRNAMDFSEMERFQQANKDKKRIQYFRGFEIKPEYSIIDGGTFDGNEALEFSKLASMGNVFTFDPWGAKFLSSKKTPKNLHIIQSALWSKECSLYFSAGSDGAGAYVSEKQNGGMEQIHATSIDSFSKNNNIRVDVIKLDIEGSELEALDGAIDTIKKYNPLMAICVYHKPNHLYEVMKKVSSISSDYQFGFWHYSNSINESVLYCSTKGFMNNA